MLRKKKIKKLDFYNTLIYNVDMREKIEHREHLAFYQISTNDLGIDRFSKQVIRKTYFIPSDLLSYGGIPLIFTLVLLMVHKRFQGKKIDFYVPLNKKEEFYDSFELALVLRGVIKGFRKIMALRKRKGDELKQSDIENIMEKLIDYGLLEVIEKGRGVIKNEEDIEKLFPNMKVSFTKEGDLSIKIGGAYEFEKRESQRLPLPPKLKLESSIHKI